MEAQGVNRVLIVVKDLDKAVAFYSKLLGATFNDAKVEEKFGVRAAISWDAGIEMISPIPGAGGMTKVMEEFLEKHGEGVYAVVFSVSNVEEARAKAGEIGIDTTLLEFNPDEIKKHFQDRFRIFKEYLFKPEDAFGVHMAVGQIEPK